MQTFAPTVGEVDAMQDRYVGDIGDYVKLALLRAVAPRGGIGVLWWRVPDESHNRDGRHVRYADEPNRWRHYDRGVFDALKAIIIGKQRSIASLERSGLLRGATFVSDCVPCGQDWRNRQALRQAWFDAACAKVKRCDIVFVDPDNGLAPDGHSPNRKGAVKSVTLGELGSLQRAGRTLILYHHQTRRPGGHFAEIQYQAARLRQIGFDRVDALRAKPGSARVFFILDGPSAVRSAAEHFARDWEEWVTWHPDADVKVAARVHQIPKGKPARPDAAVEPTSAQ